MIKPVHILIVDDNPDLLDGTARLLEKAGYAVAKASTGEGALKAVHSRRPDLLLLDHDLPDLNGIEVCRRVKQEPTMSGLFVILISGIYTESTEQAEGLESGADGYITRPLSNRELLARVESYVRIFRLQTQLAEARKMETVGRLAGGVAHHFNNLLMGIMNYAELCRDNLPPDHPIRGYLDEITYDAQRSAELTRQLLGFARKQAIAPKTLNLNNTVAGSLQRLRSLVGSCIDLVSVPASALWPVTCDPAQVDQILTHLCTHGRDAIAGAGTITIKTSNVTLDPAKGTPHVHAISGDYVLLSVSDNGCGMDKETAAKLFEPFVNTRDLYTDAGLRLATVYGIVKQNNGVIAVDSEPGSGTTFRLYFPRATPGHGNAAPV